jgi:hypothetical protein
MRVVRRVQNDTRLLRHVRVLLLRRVSVGVRVVCVLQELHWLLRLDGLLRSVVHLLGHLAHGARGAVVTRLPAKRALGFPRNGLRADGRETVRHWAQAQGSDTLQRSGSCDVLRRQCWNRVERSEKPRPQVSQTKGRSPE